MFLLKYGKGLFYATDATGRFYPMQPQLSYLTAIAFKDNEIWVGTDGGGIYTLPLPPIQAEVSAKPTFQHWPTPSDGQMHLTSDVFFTDEIQLDVLDAAGRLATSVLLNRDRSGIWISQPLRMVCTLLPCERHWAFQR